jgi:hypothetical protein
MLYYHRDPEYGRNHRRVIRKRGNAKSYKCAICVQQAQSWSWQWRTCPDPSDPASYAPLCYYCHVEYDHVFVIVPAAEDMNREILVAHFLKRHGPLKPQTVKRHAEYHEQPRNFNHEHKPPAAREPAKPFDLSRAILVRQRPEPDRDERNRPDRSPVPGTPFKPLASLTGPSSAIRSK